MACGSSSQYEDLIKIVTYKLKNRQIVREEIILAIEEVEQSIKNYCAIPQVPKALKFVWSNMTVELLDYEYERTKESLADTGEIDISTVAEISVGDTSVKMKKRLRNAFQKS